MATRVAAPQSEDFDLLSAIWILASNDDNPTITYEGIRFRLGVSDTVFVQRLVASRPELFRLGVPAKRLERWKERLREGKVLPSWLRTIQDPNERQARINALTADDAFRSQFRAAREAPRSAVPIIEWGLKHLERLREGRLRSRDERVKKWTAIGIPLVSIAAVILTTGASIAIQYCYAPRVEASVQREQLAFAARQDGYSRLMASLIAGREAAGHGERADVMAAMNRASVAFYALQPFVPPEIADNTWQAIGGYQRMLVALTADGAKSRTLSDSLNRLEARIQANLVSHIQGP